MADEKPTQNIQMRVDETRTRATYANAFRHQSSAQEVILDFGINVVSPPNPQEPESPQQMNFQIDNRLVMNYVTTKRLAAMLVQLVKTYEQKHGEIKMDQQQPPKG